MAEPVLREQSLPDPIWFPPSEALPSAGVSKAQETVALPAALPPPEAMAPRLEVREESAPAWVPASQALLEQLQRRGHELKARMESTARGARRSLATELNDDMDYVKVRARYYHERQPLQAVGIVAACAFVLGMIFGFWRR